jgi:hypothetical protein
MYKGITYQYFVLPYGLSNSVASYTRCVNKVLGPEILSHTHPYIDDLITVSQTFKDHVRHLDQLYARPIECGMTIKFSKTIICRSEIPCLGHILTTEDIKIDKSKLDAIYNFSRPKKHKIVQAFLGLWN